MAVTQYLNTFSLEKSWADSWNIVFLHHKFIWEHIDILPVAQDYINLQIKTTQI